MFPPPKCFVAIVAVRLSLNIYRFEEKAKKEKTKKRKEKKKEKKQKKIRAILTRILISEN